MDRTMCSGLLVLFSLALLYHRPAVAQVLDYGDCQSPLNLPSRCRQLRDCPLIQQLARKYQRTHPDFFSDSLCVEEDGNPIVCCPIGSENFNIDQNSNPNNDRNNNNYENDNRDGQSKRTRYGPLSAPECGYVDVKFTRIVHGVPAKLGAWPWAALLGYRSRKHPGRPDWKCGGALISSRHILTAGHCLRGLEQSLYVVRVGELDYNNDTDGATPEDVYVDRIIIHPQFKPRAREPAQYFNDIGIVRLDRDVTFTKLLKPICLPVAPELRTRDLTDFYPYVVGWGSLSYNGPSSSRLQQLQLPLVNGDECRNIFYGKAEIDPYTQLCAGYKEGGQDACKGDSGGPMMLPSQPNTWYSLGVVSFGFKCAEPGYPGIYTKTTEYMDWIVENLV